jgi:hypothetical protein
MYYFRIYLLRVDMRNTEEKNGHQDVDNVHDCCKRGAHEYSLTLVHCTYDGGDNVHDCCKRGAHEYSLTLVHCTYDGGDNVHDCCTRGAHE